MDIAWYGVCGRYSSFALSGCDLVLGVQWLSTLGTIEWDFKNLRMAFTYQGRQHVLRGMSTKKLELMSQGKLSKALKTTSYLCMLELIQMPGSSCMTLEVEDKDGTPPEVQQLLGAYDDLFLEPTTLLPSRGHFDHKIPLKEGTSPINLRPYRYPLRHKDIIERLVGEILDRGVIQNKF